jgi:hypothetical protein
VKEARAAVRVLSCTLQSLAETGEFSPQHAASLDSVLALVVKLIKNRKVLSDARDLGINIVMKHAKTGDVAKR